jgi:hypothetical protein
MMPGIKILQAKSTGESVGGTTGEAAAGEGEVGDSEAAGAPGETVGEGAMGDQQRQHVRCF